MTHDEGPAPAAVRVTSGAARGSRTTSPALLRRLAVAMDTYAWAIGHHLRTDRRHYELVTAEALALVGWRPGPRHAVSLTVEGDGESWRATARGAVRDATEYGYSSTRGADGPPPRTVGPTVPQPGTGVPAAGLAIRDVGGSIEIGALTRALTDGGVTTADVLAATVALGRHLAQPGAPWVVAARESTRTVGDLRSLLSTLDRAGGRHVVSTVAMAFVGDRTRAVAVPAWVHDPSVPVRGQLVTGPLPEDIWHVTQAAVRLAPRMRLVTDEGDGEGPVPEEGPGLRA